MHFFGSTVLAQAWLADYYLVLTESGGEYGLRLSSARHPSQASVSVDIPRSRPYAVIYNTEVGCRPLRESSADSTGQRASICLIVLA